MASPFTAPLATLLAALPGPPGPGPAARDACALVSAADAAAALGAAAGRGRPERAQGSNACRWAGPDPERHLFVAIVPAGDLHRARSFGGRPLTGIGDEAVWFLGTLFIRKGLLCVQVSLYLGPDSMKAMDAEILTLGRAVAGRM